MPAEPTPTGGGDDLTVTPGTGRVAFTGQPVSLNFEARPISVQDHIALQDADLRQWMARRIMWVFVGTNIATLVAFAGLVGLDHASGGGPAPGDRIITSQVFMTLLGATTVQVGSIAFTIAGYLFPRRTTRP